MSTYSQVLVLARPERVRAIEQFLLGSQRKFAVAVASSNDELGEQLLKLQPDAVVFDQLSDIGNRPGCLALVTKAGAGVPVVVVGPELDYDDAVKAFEEGAADYVATDNLKRLAWTLERAMRSHRDRLEREEGLKRQLRASIRRFHVYADASRDWVWEIDASLHLVYSNRAIEATLGYKPNALIGSDISTLLSDPSRAEVKRGFPRVLRRAGTFQGWRLQWRHADGHLKTLESMGVPLFDDDGKVSGYRGMSHDLTEDLKKEERLRYLALHHPVSGLPNRHALACHLSGLAPDQRIAVAAVEVNKTAHITSARGHAFAERVFSQVGSQLRRDGVFVAHVEGPLFLMAWSPEGTLEQEAAQLDAQLVCLEEQGTELDGQEVHVTFRAGIAVGHAHERESVEKDAHAALSKAFKHGQRLVPFNEEVRRRVARTIDLERELRHALDREEFELHYQPKFSASTRRLTGAEALLRWRRPGDRLVSPADFIPLLEDTGLIVPVGRWVMAQALATTLEWRRTLWPGLRVAVNVSAQEFRHRDFLTEAADLLEPFADYQPIDIELTESVLVDDVEQSAEVLRQLRTLGCKVDIDDFGTGYSSLNYLIRLPIDGLKIDRSFIAVLTESPEKMALSSTIISLAHSLGLSVVAEGVETEDQARLLHLLRCDVLQGFLLGRPMDAQAFAENVLAGGPIKNPA
ncbi:MAG: putative bifunctional diguanylate cyclase/phosphodiesterase [Gemmatimonadaceae bacterium]